MLILLNAKLLWNFTAHFRVKEIALPCGEEPPSALFSKSGVWRLGVWLPLSFPVSFPPHAACTWKTPPRCDAVWNWSPTRGWYMYLCQTSFQRWTPIPKLHQFSPRYNVVVLMWRGRKGEGKKHNFSCSPCSCLGCAKEEEKSFVTICATDKFLPPLNLCRSEVHLW